MHVRILICNMRAGLEFTLVLNVVIVLECSRIWGRCSNGELFNGCGDGARNSMVAVPSAGCATRRLLSRWGQQLHDGDAVHEVVKIGCMDGYAWLTSPMTADRRIQLDKKINQEQFGRLYLPDEYLATCIDAHNPSRLGLPARPHKNLIHTNIESLFSNMMSCHKTCCMPAARFVVISMHENRNYAVDCFIGSREK